MSSSCIFDCVRDAVLARLNNQISEETYLQCIVDHSTGIRHGANKSCKGDDSALYISQKVDPFASLMVNWISGLKVITDTAPLYATLHAYRSRDAQAFKAGIHEMDRVYECVCHSERLCQKALAMHALLVRDAKMLEAVLDVCADSIEWPFHREYNGIKYKWSQRKIVWVVRKSRFKSFVTRGKRFPDDPALDYLA